MTVSAGVGGTSVVGVILGGGAVKQGVTPGDVVKMLPYTGATHLMLYIALAIFLIVFGSLCYGLSKVARN